MPVPTKSNDHRKQTTLPPTLTWTLRLTGCVQNQHFTVFCWFLLASHNNTSSWTDYRVYISNIREDSFDQWILSGQWIKTPCAVAYDHLLALFITALSWSCWHYLSYPTTTTAHRNMLQLLPSHSSFLVYLLFTIIKYFRNELRKKFEDNLIRVLEKYKNIGNL